LRIFAWRGLVRKGPGRHAVSGQRGVICQPCLSRRLPSGRLGLEPPPPLSTQGEHLEDRRLGRVCAQARGRRSPTRRLGPWRCAPPGMAPAVLYTSDCEERKDCETEGLWGSGKPNNCPNRRGNPRPPLGGKGLGKATGTGEHFLRNVPPPRHSRVITTAAVGSLPRTLVMSSSSFYYYRV